MTGPPGLEEYIGRAVSKCTGFDLVIDMVVELYLWVLYNLEQKNCILGGVVGF